SCSLSAGSAPTPTPSTSSRRKRRRSGWWVPAKKLVPGQQHADTGAYLFERLGQVRQIAYRHRDATRPITGSPQWRHEDRGQRAPREHAYPGLIARRADDQVCSEANYGEKAGVDEGGDEEEERQVASAQLIRRFAFACQPRQIAPGWRVGEP